MFVAIAMRYKNEGYAPFTKKYIVPEAFQSWANDNKITLIPVCTNSNIKK